MTVCISCNLGTLSVSRVAEEDVRNYVAVEKREKIGEEERSQRKEQHVKQEMHW
jgi:hypothetical protein